VILVATKNDIQPLTPKQVRQLLSEWFAAKQPTTVAFKEVIEPPFDPYADYSVVYEAIFEPPSLDQAAVELWVTRDGDVAIGFERRKRIAERLGVKSRNNRFAAGHEPRRMRESDLITILNSIATGEIAVASTVMPFLGLISTKAVTLHAVLERLGPKGCSPVNWLNGVSREEFSRGGHFLRFRPWDR
jgi:hypothetical protein